MAPRGYTEQELVEKSAIDVFKSLGYEHQDCYYEQFGKTAGLGRETPMEVVLISRLEIALTRLNPTIPKTAIALAIEEITKDRSALNTTTANKEIYKLIRDGVRVSIRKDDGSEDEETVKVIDFAQASNNDFFLTSQLWISGDMYKRRADLIGFVNGLPLIFVELKAVHRKLENAYYGNLKDYKDTIPQLFWYNAFVILSNGSKSRIGTVTADWEHFSEWKRINSEGEKGIVSLDTIIKGTCQKERFIDILENFILYQDIGGSFIKILSKYYQYLGVNNAIESFKNAEKSEGRLGVFWHTQGSGKSFSMIFLSQKILRKFYGDYTFVIVTDRKELDEQIYKNFADVGAVTEQEVHAESSVHLQQLLKENHRNVFTLIHKFRDDESYPVSLRKDIIVIADEAHRTQYDSLAMNMRKALPNASFIAFTATPLISGEQKTKETFGDYVSVYSFKQSWEDRATVPLYYENRIPEVEIVNEGFAEKLGTIIDGANLDDKQEEKLAREFAREYHIITRDDRLDKVAEDIVSHFANRGYQGKAMVVSIDKPTAVRMYDKVKKRWQKYIGKLSEDLKKAKGDEEKKSIYDTINYMQQTDMAVVISGEQNEVDKFRKLNLDIAIHRERMNKEDLATKFKKINDPFRIVFVCAMWMTGFDVPCLSTIYLDKPMKNHTLMQTIARANRIFGDKPNGLIVDYIGIFRSLEKALAIYNPGGGDIGYPVKPKEELLKDLGDYIAKAVDLLKKLDIDLSKIIEAKSLEKIKLLDDAVDALLADDKVKKEFIALVNAVRQVYRAILPDPRVDEFRDRYVALKVIVEKIRSLYPDVDIEGVKGEIEDLLDESLKAKDYITTRIKGSQKVDLGKIDFDAIKKKLVDNRKHIEAEKLKNLLGQKLVAMMKLNKKRQEFIDKFQELINEYNSGTINVELFFKKLSEFAKALDEEDKRSIVEKLTEEQLAIFDLLYKPDLTKKETEQVKLAAKDLLDKLKTEKFVLDWRRKQQARADVLLTIQTILDGELPESYTPEVYEEKCGLVYQHVYDSYFGQGRRIYEMVQVKR